MADIYEKDFEERSQPLATDFLRLIGGDDDVAYKVLVSDIAKAIIEQYTGSTIAGEEQSLQTALNAINTGIGNTAMGTTATTLTGAIAEHTDKIGNDSMGTTATSLTGAIAEHSDLIGDDTMGTTATTLTGAIAEHEQELGDLNSNTRRTSIDASTIQTPLDTTETTVSAERVGKNIYISFRGQNRTHTVDETFMVIPPAYRPYGNRYFPAFVCGNCCIVCMYTNGNVSVWTSNVPSGAGRICVNMSYCID